MVHYQYQRYQYSSWRKGTRFYGLELRQDIFGNWLVHKVWGSNRHRGSGQSQDLICDNYEEAEKVYQKQSQKRIKRGYQIV
jgi:predicted DNA-binding WGR domain protein